jgi:hypothetical protein
MPLDADPSPGLPPPSGIVSLVGNRACLGTLIDPSLVLTAAHCVVDGAKHSAVRVRGRTGTLDVTVARCRVHPEAYGAPTHCGARPRGRLQAAHDLALLDLDRALALAEARPIPAACGPLPGLARSIVQVTSAHATELQSRSSWRASPQDVERLDGGVFVTRPRMRLPWLSTRPGDSGGPALLVRGSVVLAVGTLSGGRTPWSADSWFAATFAPGNARWLGGACGTILLQPLSFARD